MTPEELKTLADRIDYDKQWRKSPLLDSCTPEERDRRDAGVNLRRYASGLGIANAERAKGAMYIRGWRLEDHTGGTYGEGCGHSKWNKAICDFDDKEPERNTSGTKMMYAASQASSRIPGVISLFERERKNGLPTEFKLCGHETTGVPLPDNHLVCALNVACRNCEYLKAIDESAEMTPESKDEAKAWTCITHVLTKNSRNLYTTTPFVSDKSSAALESRMSGVYQEWS